ncbi:hypothetical protein [Streptomyces cinereoruber]|uniref:hypothetical protein n=1 Tax=Streptomyces cinereoruber TaxID=67260 RepID=UPI00362F3008
MLTITPYVKQEESGQKPAEHPSHALASRTSSSGERSLCRGGRAWRREEGSVMVVGMAALIVVGEGSVLKGRQVQVMRRGKAQYVGTAFSDHDVVAILQAAGLSDPEEVLDDPRWVQWCGGRTWKPLP